MKATIQIDNQWYATNLQEPIDLSIPLKEGMENVNCFYAPPMQAEPVVAGDFIGSTAKGGPVNFLNVRINPHGNGTHTECVGHIAKEKYTINKALTTFMFPARLISVFPKKMDSGDRVICKDQLEELLEGNTIPEALIIRTLPNDSLKLRTNYSGANPPYIDQAATAYLVENGVNHLLVDLPSVDREEDGGSLLSHKAFWKYPETPRTNCTISELLFLPNEIKDGFYLLNIQIASFELDVSPSKPVLYKLVKMK